MQFNSYLFILAFLPLVLLGYFGLHHLRRHRAAKVFLTAASFCFYGYADVKYLFILWGSILVNYLFAGLIGRQQDRRKGRILTGVGIALNVALLFYIKYYNFFLENLNAALRRDFALIDVIVPLGISFFTFQQIAYLVDSFRGENGEHTFLDYCVYISFFPCITSGPIALAKNMLPQFQDEKNMSVNWENLAYGLWLFAIGLFKKAVLADTFGEAVTWGFASAELSSLETLIVMLSYTFQLYFDFSGYSDMAMGVGQMFNIRLPLNFNAPYMSCSIIEFWDRWHMSLTGFLREYIYFPLGGSRKGKMRTYVNVMIIFLISGIWHGANWTFILWGALHGIANCLNRAFRKTWDCLPKIFRWLATFCFLNVTWLIFKADSIGQAFGMIRKILKMDSFTIHEDFSYCFSLFQNEFLTAQQNSWIMTGFLAAAFAIVLTVKSCATREMNLSTGRMLSVVFLFVWAVLSLSGVSTFLYFGF